MGTPYLAEIKAIAWNYAPKGWAFCNGQTLPINQNQALFSLLGTQYGGNGQTTFCLPNLQGRVAVDQGNGFTIGSVGGQTSHTLTQPEMPAHTHTIAAGTGTATTSNPHSGVFDVPNVAARSGNLYSAAGGSTAAADAISNTGGSQPHENEMPYLVLNYIIALQGIFPSRN